MTCAVAKTLLSAYQDGELNLEQVKSLEIHLKECQSCEAVFDQNVAIGSAIRSQAPTYPTPESLRQRLPRPKSKGFVWPSFVGGLSVGLAMTLAGLILFLPTGRNLTDELVSDHVRSLMANHLVDVVSSDRHTVKPWFLGKIDFAPDVPELRAEGYPLLGGRLDYVAGHTAAALVYGKKKHVINVLVMPAEREGSGGRESNGYRIARWKIGDLDYWAISDISAQDLDQFARVFQAKR